MPDDPTKQQGDINNDAAAAAAAAAASGSDAASQGDKGQGAAAPQDKDQPKTIEVTVDVLKALRAENKSLKDQNALYKAQQAASAHLSMNPTVMPNPTVVAQGIQTSANVRGGEVSFDIDDEDVVTGADMKRILKVVQGQQQHVDPTLVQRLAYIELGQQDPKWQETIQKFLPEMISNNPLIAQQIRGAENPLQAALLFAKMNPKYAEAQAQLVAANAVVPETDDLMSQIDKMIANAEKPGGGAKQSGSPGVQTGDRFSAMTDEDIDAHMRKVLAGTQ